MKKQIWILIAIIMIASLFFGYQKLIKIPTGKIIEQPGLIDGTNETPTTHLIKIINFGFYPKTIEINKNDFITWENKDFVSHKIMSENLSDLNSGELKRLKKYSYKFTESGTYEYYCEIHPWMKGTIVVK